MKISDATPESVLKRREEYAKAYGTPEQKRAKGNWGDKEGPAPRKRWVTKLMHPSYVVEECPVCGFPEADGGACAECGWVHCNGSKHDNRPVT